jgi:acyl-CoA synthetase (AMP-forming)/AMP-acid ligase II
VRGLSFLDSGVGSRRPALLIEGGDALTHADLAVLVDRLADRLDRPATSVVLCRMARDLPTVVGYLAALAAGHCVLPVERASDATLADLVTAYQPEIILGATADGFRTGHHPVGTADLLVATGAKQGPPVHPGTGLLLRTSGSLGRPKTVRLSYANVAANAASIASALRLSAGDRAPTTLPLDYSFGLSILHSHLIAGASLALTRRSPTSARFGPWSAAAGCTALYAVPTTYQLLAARRWQAADHPHLRSLYQAGGAMRPEHIRYFAGQMATTGGSLTVMYGQTEATARMTVLDPVLVQRHLGSVGRAIPGGELWVEREGEPGIPAPDGEIGEVRYRGPNVMLGYATDRADLANDDECRGVLATGDLGRVQDGLLYLTGRRDRVVKLLGRRINLADVETAFGGIARDVAALFTSDGADGGRVVVCLAGDIAAEEPLASRRQSVAAELGLPVPMITVIRVPELPTTGSGKVDYAALRAMVSAEAGGPVRD